MQMALYPKDEARVSVEEFLRRAGPDWREKGLFPICRSCRRRVYVWGEHSPGVTHRFQHYPGETNCALASEEREDRETEHGSRADGERLRAWFGSEEVVRAAYALCRKICGRGGLSGAEFVELVRRADARGIWSFRNLPGWAVPYILLTLGEYVRVTPNGKDISYRFVLRKPRRQGGAWIDPAQCRLQKIYIDTGNPVRDGPFQNGEYPISEQAFRRAADETSWMSDGLLAVLRRAREPAHAGAR